MSAKSTQPRNQAERCRICVSAEINLPLIPTIAKFAHGIVIYNLIGAVIPEKPANSLPHKLPITFPFIIYKNIL